MSTRSVLVLAVFVALPAFSEEAKPAATPAPAATEAAKPAPKAAPASPGAANLVVTKDPETGELRPATAAEREKLLGRKPLVPVERKVVTLPDGSLMIELGEADLHYAVVKKAADGTLTGTCVHGDPKAEKKPTPAPPTADR